MAASVPPGRFDDVRREWIAFHQGSVPGLVGMRELGVCQHFSDKFEPNCPDQDDKSI
jgi:hypothetical protein